MSSSQSESVTTLDKAPSGATPALRRDAAQARPEVMDKRSPAANQADPQRSPGQQRLRLALFLLLPLALIGAGLYYVYGGKVIATDDAYVNAKKVAISTDVSGIVASVEVHDNQQVNAGQILYRLDPMRFRIALEQAEADRTQTALSLKAMERGYRRMLAEAAAAEARVRLDRTNYARAVRLLANGVESRADYDQARFKLRADRDRLAALREQATVQLAQLDGNAHLPVSRWPRYQQAEARVAEARRELRHSVVRAPFAGVATDVSAIAPGKYLPASAAAFYLVDTHHLWVEAKPKETQLTHVRPGEPATVTVDTYPNVKWRGTVESVSPATAQEFSLLPAQNSSGNWVKVVQRVKLRIRLDGSEKPMPPLSAGMSAEVDIDTGHARGLPHFLSDLF